MDVGEALVLHGGALALAWVGYKLAERPADPQRSYGFARMKILAAFTNGILLVLLSLCWGLPAVPCQFFC